MSSGSSSQPNFIIYLNFYFKWCEALFLFSALWGQWWKIQAKPEICGTGSQISNFKKNWISFGISDVVPSRVNLYDVLKRKSTKTKSNQICDNPKWDIFSPQKIDPGAPKMKISENPQNHQKWCKTSPEHENKLK